MITFIPNKKKILIWAGSILLVFIVLALSTVLYLKKISPPPATTSETLTQKQLRELDELRDKYGVSTSTPEQIAEQLKILDSLHKETNPQSFSSEQIQKQLEELDKLKSQYQIN